MLHQRPTLLAVVTAMAANLQSKLEYDTGVEGTRASLRFRL